MAASTFPSRAAWPRVQTVAAIVRRDYQLTRSYHLAFGLDLFLGVANLVLYYFISRTFGGVHDANLGGAPTYFAFAVVGIVTTLVMQAASTSLAVRIREEQLTGTLEALVAQPLTTVELVVGLAGFAVVFALFRAVAYLAIAWAWLGVDLNQTNWPATVLVFVATSTAVTSLGIALASAVLVIKKGDVLAGLTVFVLGLLGGSLFPVSVLPAWAQALAKLVPFRYAFDGLRRTLFGGTGWGEDAVILGVFSVVMFPVALWVFAVAVRLAVRAGSLGQY